jgi:hypothetical protein
VLPGVAITFTALNIFYFLAYYFIIDRTNLKTNDARKKQKLCYQLTNLVTNLCLGLAGVYVDRGLQKMELTTEQTVQGFENFVGFSAAQLGYQFWAIPLGIFFVGESPLMIMHHFTVILVAGMSGFLTNGFRYWTPFFYGLIELSSVPLAIMNSFKENPHLIERHPSAYSMIRYIFAATFLYIRVVMFVPRHISYVRDQFLLFTTHDSIPYQIFMGFCWASSMTLLVLQLFWATLIVKGIVAANRKNTHRAIEKQS